jgi:carboxyl-terminal processing protease
MLSTKVILLGLAFFTPTVFSQELSKLDRGRAQDILKVVGDDVRKHYYDPKFHGLNWDAEIGEAKDKISQAKSFSMAMAHIAAMLDKLNDSHTFFLPPEHAYRHDFGWRYQMIGERCFITQVRPKSDAETKGLKPGDEVLTVNGFTPDRSSFWRMKYLFSVLRPQPSLKLGLQDLVGTQRQVEVAAKIREVKHLTDLTAANGASDIWDIIREEQTEQHLMRARTVERGDELMILKLPEFSLSPIEVGDLITKARKHKALVMDLRGNPGGDVETLKNFIGGVFDKDIKIGDRSGRKETKPVVAKSFRSPFGGKLIVIVDGESASAAELFARVIQLEKRGSVFGDRTSGSVMEARHYDEKWGADINIFYGVSITDADIIMSDGKSLEHTGVVPDELLLPSPAALANGRDPVLARAAEFLGVKISSEEAGKLFPYEWAPE